MKYEIGDLTKDEDGNEGIVCIKWNDGDICSLENDAAHPSPVIIGHWPLKEDSDGDRAPLQSKVLGLSGKARVAKKQEQEMPNVKAEVDVKQLRGIVHESQPLDRAVKTFVIKEGMYAATADLMKICSEFVRSFLQTDDVTGTWYYFNRLLVNKNIRGRGLATKLMSRVIFWADTENINILNELNPYGDLNMDQLISFYKKFGFKQPNNNIPLMIRRA